MDEVLENASFALICFNDGSNWIIAHGTNYLMNSPRFAKLCAICESDSTSSIDVLRSMVCC